MTDESLEKTLRQLGESLEEVMISYAQNCEDVLLRRCFPRGVGRYIDVGANDPCHYSVTKYFYDRGWQGIDIEPIKRHYLQLKAARPRDVVLNVALSDQPGTRSLFVSDFLTALSTFSREEAQAHEARGVRFVERPVEVSTLGAVCQEHNLHEVDFLSIDVEGHEHAVLLGGDWERYRPRVVLLEAARPLTRVQTHLPSDQFLLSVGYVEATFDGLNRYYVRSEDRALAERLKDPVNVFDNFVPYEYFRHVGQFRKSVERALKEANPRAELTRLLARLDEFERDPYHFKLGHTKQELAAFYDAAEGGPRR